MGCWCGYLSGVRCRLSAYGPGDASAIPCIIMYCVACNIICIVQGRNREGRWRFLPSVQNGQRSDRRSQHRHNILCQVSPVLSQSYYVIFSFFITTKSIYINFFVCCSMISLSRLVARVIFVSKNENCRKWKIATLFTKTVYRMATSLEYSYSGISLNMENLRNYVQPGKNCNKQSSFFVRHSDICVKQLFAG